ncbi:MAG: type II toxin-antitoxin system RelE/ParE family toxin [Candidatus Peregrinibacteria bacterium]
MARTLHYRLSTSATKDLQDLRCFLKERMEIEVFMVLRKRIVTAITLIREFPELGQYNNDIQARIFPISKTQYILIFRVKNDVVEVLRIFHTAQKRETIR